MQKPIFAFYTLALLIAFSLSACKFNPDMQKPGEGYLQGEWQQDTITGQNKLVSYSLYHLKFSCDSFFVSISTFSKVNTGADSCTSTGRWTEYCKGTYVQVKDTLHLKGQFVNADMSIKDEKSCFRAGDYEEIFKVTKKTDKQAQFASTSNVIPIDAHLIKKTSCNPKPL
ncbi:fumarate hydratase [Mucilaginibacter sp.]|uniref:fumarate hydratase n=1 Tax=Mucilaginibacter sp. TaxID=1882438 RepID=UPI003D100A9E